jgi:chromosome segregation ATPase
VTDERLTLRQAAARLGVSESAVRKRVERGTLRSDKGPDGRRYVYLDTGADAVADEGADASATGERDALISEIRAHNDTLREQLEAERQGHAEARRLLAAALERIPPQLEAPQEASEDAETVEEAPDKLGTERARREMAETTLREGMAEERRRREEAERERDELRRELHAHGRQQEAHEAAEEQQGRGQSQSAAGGSQQGARRPWWRRVFGR